MNKKILAGAISAGVIAIVIVAVFLSTQTTMLQKNEKLGLYILTPSSTPTLTDLKEAYTEAVSAGIGRSNVYLFWPTLEPQQGQYDWKI
ncbi:MAG TPA: hypothetical protein VLB45_01145, partial [Nitrosopumilaceae archaeon]|nr:hypothetical protein [Nitrosopumilaceae archaeon]